MMAGKPMLVSYTGYLSLINEADCGLAVPSEDVNALLDALKKFSSANKEELKTMGLRGKEFVMKNRTFDKLAEKYMELF